MGFLKPRSEKMVAGSSASSRADFDVCIDDVKFVK
jgi:hypothetical protein